VILDPVANDALKDRYKVEGQDDLIDSKLFAKLAVYLWRREEDPLLCSMANHLTPKAFYSSITQCFSGDIAIVEADLGKTIVGDSGIFETGSVVEVMRIGRHRRLSSLVSSDEVRAITYCFDNIEILMKDTNRTIATADKEP
jgi:hypothetical protein